MQQRHLHKGINTHDYAATSCKNLVNFCAVTPEITFLYLYLCMVIGRNRSMISIHHAGISRRIGRLKCWWVRSKWRWTCTSHVNLVGFYLVHLQLPVLLLNCVQQASMSTRVTTTRRQHVCVSVGDDTAMPDGRYARLFHAFLVYHSFAQKLYAVCNRKKNVQ